MGVKALPWLQEVQTTYHLPVAIEVAQPEHIEAALKHNINFFWIGARTTANPFSVQELAEALQGVNCRVMVKNPIHPDLQLWIGAIERAGDLQRRHAEEGFALAVNCPGEGSQEDEDLFGEHKHRFAIDPQRLLIRRPHGKEIPNRIFVSEKTEGIKPSISI